MKTWLRVHKGFGAGPVAVCCWSHPGWCCYGTARVALGAGWQPQQACRWVQSTGTAGEADVVLPGTEGGCTVQRAAPARGPHHGKALRAGLHRPRVPLCEMSLLHAMLQSRIPRPYLDIKEIDLIVRPLKQAFNSILWGLKTLLNNWAAKRLVISVFIAHIDLSVVNPFKYPCHTGPDGSL